MDICFTIIQAKLFVLMSSALQLTNKKFLKLLIQSDMVNPQLIAHIFELSPGENNWLTGSEILTLLYRKGSPKEFCKSYLAALGNDIINMKDSDMIKQLADILNGSKEFTDQHVIRIMTDSCLHIESFRAAGKFLHDFCIFLPKEDDACSFITDGKDASVLLYLLFSLII